MRVLVVMAVCCNNVDLLELDGISADFVKYSAEQSSLSKIWLEENKQLYSKHFKRGV